MSPRILAIIFLLTLLLGVAPAADPAPKAADPTPKGQQPNTWVKRSPVKTGPVSPPLGCEGSMAYDPRSKLVIRWGGQNQGGGEQLAETWTLNPVSGAWKLMQPDTSPPGASCDTQTAFETAGNHFLRFPAFSGQHGWHWFREDYLSTSSVWSYDLVQDSWRDMRPLPAPRLSPLRCASWDSDHQVVVIFGGEGNLEGTVVYDPWTNTWTRMNPPQQPAFRSGGNMVYDAEHKLHILFGAQLSDDPHTWAYDLRKNQWRDMKPEVMPPTDRCDAVMAYDAANKVVIAVVQAIDKADDKQIFEGHLETWAYDAGKNTWTRMNPPREPDGFGNRRRVMVAIPDQNLILMETYVNPTLRVPGVEREQQIWTYRYAVPKPKPKPVVPPPQEISLTLKDAQVALKWEAGKKGEDFVIYRAEGTKLWKADFKPIARVRAGANDDAVFTEYLDTNVQPGIVYSYRLRTISERGVQSADSVLLRTQPRLVEQGLVSVTSSQSVRISWKHAPGGLQIAGYHVERAPVEVFTEEQLLRLKQDTPTLSDPSIGAVRAIGKFERLTREPIQRNFFTDTDVDLTRPQRVQGEAIYMHRFPRQQIDPTGKPYRFAVYAYRIRAVNILGMEGGDSPYHLTIPTSPKYLECKEDGTDCKLRWQDNPELNLMGYRVYRMEGPRINGPGQKCIRLTADPIREWEYTDANVGKDTRRYWVVAVDALGQEGIPSAPAWAYREYRQFYAPFVKEWHP